MSSGSTQLNPRILAKMIMDKHARQIQIYSSILPKTCDCPDHEDSHNTYESFLRMSSNYQKLADTFDKYLYRDNQNIALIAELLLFADSELDRQSDLFIDVRMSSLTPPSDNVEKNGSTVT